MTSPDTYPHPHEHTTLTRVSVFTDGSATNNGAKNARAGVGVHFTDDWLSDISLPVPPTYRQTNNVAELLAIKLAILKLCEYYTTLTVGSQLKVTLYTDSKFAIDCITVWIHNWKRNDWQTSKNKPVEHRELISEIDHLLQQISVEFVHVRAHKSKPLEKSIEYFNWLGNFKADALAVAGSLDRYTVHGIE